MIELDCVGYARLTSLQDANSSGILHIKIIQICQNAIENINALINNSEKIILKRGDQTIAQAQIKTKELKNKNISSQQAKKIRKTHNSDVLVEKNQIILIFRKNITFSEQNSANIKHLIFEILKIDDELSHKEKKREEDSDLSILDIWKFLKTNAKSISIFAIPLLALIVSLYSPAINKEIVTYS